MGTGQSDVSLLFLKSKKCDVDVSPLFEGSRKKVDASNLFYFISLQTVPPKMTNCPAREADLLARIHVMGWGLFSSSLPIMHCMVEMVRK